MHQLKKKERKENMKRQGFSATGEFVKVNHNNKKKINFMKQINVS